MATAGTRDSAGKVGLMVRFRISPDFVRRGGRRMTENDVARVLENADAIGDRFAKGGGLGRLLEDGKLLLALIRDYWSREYRAAPFWVIGAAAFALLYVLAPLDMLPDAMPVVGQIDDVAVVSICVALVRQELKKYEAWRKSRGSG